MTASPPLRGRGCRRPRSRRDTTQQNPESGAPGNGRARRALPKSRKLHRFPAKCGKLPILRQNPSRRFTLPLPSLASKWPQTNLFTFLSCCKKYFFVVYYQNKFLRDTPRRLAERLKAGRTAKKRREAFFCCSIGQAAHEVVS